MIEAKFTIAVGSYQNVKLTIKGDTAAQFEHELNSVADQLKAKLGIFHAEAESWIRGTYDKIAEEGLEAAVAQLQNELGATVVETIPTPPEPPQDASQPAWNRKPATTKPEPWKAPATTNDGDDW